MATINSTKPVEKENSMDQTALITMGINLLFGVLVAASYVMYGIAFNRLGGLPEEKSLFTLFNFAINVLLSPYFIAGLALALGGSIVRMGLFSMIGITRSALAAELSLIMMLIFSAIVFKEMPRFPRDYMGGLFILIGSYIVAS